MNELIVIDLFGEQFRFKPDSQVKDPDKVASTLKNYINEAEILFQSKPSGKNRTAMLLLAAMNIARDFHELELKSAQLEKQVESRLALINEKIDKGIHID